MARAIAVRHASAWPITPPPRTSMSMSTEVAWSPAKKSASLILRRASSGV
jgi:hypothetical protein